MAKVTRLYPSNEDLPFPAICANALEHEPSIVRAVIVGMDSTGALHAWLTCPNDAESIMLLERAKSQIINTIE